MSVVVSKNIPVVTSKLAIEHKAGVIQAYSIVQLGSEAMYSAWKEVGSV